MSQDTELPRVSNRVFYMDEVDAWPDVDQASVSLVLTRVNSFASKRNARAKAPVQTGDVA